MTAEKAISEFLYQEKMRSKGINYQADNLVIATAIEALEKQIPKRLAQRLGSRRRHVGEGEKTPCCPICYEDLLDEKNDCFKFCPECGQAVDWSD